MTTPLMIRSVNDLLYGYALSVAYRNQWTYDPDFALSKEPDIFEIVQRDPVILSAMDRRQRGIVRPWHVEPPANSRRKEDKLAATIIHQLLSKISLFNAARRRLALAPFVGRTYEFIEGERQMMQIDELPEMEWWVPTALKNIDRRRFHWVPDHARDAAGNATLSTHLEMYSIIRNVWEPVQHPEYFVRYTVADREDRVGYGRSLLEATYFYHYMKTMTFEKIGQGIDRWANGIIKGKLDSLRNASTTKTNADLLNGMKTLLRTMRSEHIAVLQDGDEIEVLETTGTGHQISMDFMRYLDEGIERLYNGSILPSGHASAQGSLARANVEEDTTETFLQADREELDEIISRDLIGMIWRMNRLNFIKLGLQAAQMPHLDSEQKKKEDPVEAAQVATTLLGQGVPIIKQELYHKTGFTMPDEDDDVVEGHAAAFNLDPFGKPIGGEQEPGKEKEEKESKSSRESEKKKAA